MKIRRTPEQEAYRISRVQIALKGKPATEEQRKKRADGLRKAWTEGRIKVSFTPESRAKTADKLRGRKRPAEVVEKVRVANLGKKRTPEQVEALRQRLIAGHAAGKYKSSPEGAERRRLAGIKAHTGRKHSEEQNRRHSEMLRGRKLRPEHVEKRAAALRGRPQAAPATAKGPTNKRSIEGALRDSGGRIWWFRNLTHFVREHPELFDASDLQWRPIRPGKSYCACNASKRLLALFGCGKVVPGTWKGWTVASSAIERTEGHADLLGRDEVNVTHNPTT